MHNLLCSLLITFLLCFRQDHMLHACYFMILSFFNILPNVQSKSIFCVLPRSKFILHYAICKCFVLHAVLPMIQSNSSICKLYFDVVYTCSHACVYIIQKIYCFEIFCHTQDFTSMNQRYTVLSFITFPIQILCVLIQNSAEIQHFATYNSFF